MTDLQTRAKQAISLLDFTNLNDNCTDADIEKLSRRGQTEFGPVAALCIFPQFIKTARKELGSPSIRIATVTNFPDGSADAKRAAKETAGAFAAGADEVDVVIAYRAILAGDPQKAAAIVIAANKEKPKGKILKVILETGLLLEEIKTSGRKVGFKAAGGIKTAKDAASYLDLADEIMGKGWATPATFRFGASSVLDDLIAVAGGGTSTAKASGY
jgi:deoxyribose-phosphate aldolase